MIAITRVLIPSDFSETSAAAVAHGVHVAERYGASLHLLHVIEKRNVPPEPEFPLGIFEGQTVARERLIAVLDAAQRKTYRPDVAVKIGHPWASNGLAGSGSSQPRLF